MDSAESTHINYISAVFKVSEYMKNMGEFIGVHDFGFDDSSMEFATNFPLNIVTRHGLPKGG